MRRPRFFSSVFAISALLVTLWIGLSWSHGFKQHSSAKLLPGAQYSQIRRSVSDTPVELASRNAPPERTIEVGAHIENIHQLSLKDKVYWMEGWYWLKWPEAIDKLIKADKVPLDQIVEFTNVVEETNLTETLDTAEPIFMDEEKRYYQLVRFSGRFYVNDLDLRRYPFVQITLPLTLEAKPDNLSCYPSGPPCVGLKPESDVVNMLVGQFADINGYDLTAAEVRPFLHQYSTTFGIHGLSAFNAIDFNLIYKTNPLAALAQYILPLMVITGIVLASPSLPGSLGDVRLAIPTTALLTLIFLQQGYQANLPSLSYTTFLDWLYLYAYLISIVFFILFCWSTNRFNYVDEDFRVDEEIIINRVDRRIQMIAVIVLFLLIPFAWLI